MTQPPQQSRRLFCISVTIQSKLASTLQDTAHSPWACRWRCGRDDFQLELLEGAGEQFDAALVDALGFLDVLGVVQGCKRARLGDGIDVEGLTNLLQSSDQLRMADAVADAKSGKAVDF